jgi:hypothetical protein
MLKYASGLGTEDAKVHESKSPFENFLPVVRHLCNYFLPAIAVCAGRGVREASLFHQFEHVIYLHVNVCMCDFMATLVVDDVWTGHAVLFS